MEREGPLFKEREGDSGPSHLRPWATVLETRGAHHRAGAQQQCACGPRPDTPPSARPTAPPPGPEVRTRTGKMEAAAEPLRSVRRLSRVLLFLSQCYILSGDGEFKAGGRTWRAGGTRAPGPAGGRRQTTGRPSPPGGGRAALQPGRKAPRSLAAVAQNPSPPGRFRFTNHICPAQPLPE